MEGYALSLKCNDEEFPLLLDLSSFLYDLELAHDFGVIVSRTEDWPPTFNRFFWYRNGRRISTHEKIRVARIVKESPLILEVVLPSLTGLWILLQIIYKIQDRPLEREKLEREVNRLRREDAIERENTIESYGTLGIGRIPSWSRSSDLSPEAVQERLEARFQKSTIKVSQVDIRRLAQRTRPSHSRDEF